MPWVRFVADFNWHPRHNVTIAFKAGMVLLVTGRCAVEAQLAGRAEPAQRPEKQDGDDARR